MKRRPLLAFFTLTLRVSAKSFLAACLLLSFLTFADSADSQNCLDAPSPSTADRIERVTGNLPAGPLGFTWRHAALADRMVHYRVPGVSIAVIDNYQIEWSCGFGAIEAGSTKPVTSHTLFQAASISKSFSALGALLLVEQGKLSLDKDVNLRLRNWKVPDNRYTAGHPVTLRELLSHTAGTTVGGFPGYPRDAQLPTLIQILDGVPPANTPPVRVDKQPGGGWRYSGGGYEIVQLLIDDVSGEAFPEYCTARSLRH
jgi:CubicO group peptidase (beta-lactamase class C family)